MSWKERCISTLDQENVFEDSMHRTRFCELMECFSDFPFFTKGLCKCMYLSAWDDEHFVVLLQTLNDMSIGKEQDTEDMRIQGDQLAEEETDGEAFIYRLASSFLEGTSLKEEQARNLPPEYQYIVKRALLVAGLVDQMN